MSKINIIIFWILVIFVTSCSSEEEDKTDVVDSSLRNATTLSTNVDGVSVLIFGENGGNFNYQDSIIPSWSEDGKATKNLVLGTYKFLFYKSAGINTRFSPANLDETITLSDIKFVAKPDPQDSLNYVLPVGDIWLADDTVANRKYVIKGSDVVKNELKRAVSQVVLKINRGYAVADSMKPLVYPDGENIMDNIQDIKLDIDGVGKEINVFGAIASSKTLYTTDRTTAEISGEGFATINGPLVLPAIANKLAEVEITLTPPANSLFDVMKTKVSGKLQRNRQLVITLWLTAAYKLIDITVDTKEISEYSDGDLGIWE